MEILPEALPDLTVPSNPEELHRQTGVLDELGRASGDINEIQVTHYGHTCCTCIYRYIYTRIYIHIYIKTY